MPAVPATADIAYRKALAAARNAFAGGAYEDSRRLAQTVLTLVESEDWLGDHNVEAEACGACILDTGPEACPEIPVPLWDLAALPASLPLPL